MLSTKQSPKLFSGSLIPPRRANPPTRCANSIMRRSQAVVIVSPGSPINTSPLFVVSIYSMGVLHYPGVVIRSTKCGDWLDYPTELHTPMAFMEWKRGRSHCKTFRLRKCARCFDD